VCASVYVHVDLCGRVGVYVYVCVVVGEVAYKIRWGERGRSPPLLIQPLVLFSNQLIIPPLNQIIFPAHLNCTLLILVLLYGRVRGSGEEGEGLFKYLFSYFGKPPFLLLLFLMELGWLDSNHCITPLLNFFLPFCLAYIVFLS